jgi:hypothetical protein
MLSRALNEVGLSACAQGAADHGRRRPAPGLPAAGGRGSAPPLAADGRPVPPALAEARRTDGRLGSRWRCDDQLNPGRPSPSSLSSSFRPVCGPATYPSEDQPPTILHALSSPRSPGKAPLREPGRPCGIECDSPAAPRCIARHWPGSRCPGSPVCRQRFTRSRRPHPLTFPVRAHAADAHSGPDPWRGGPRGVGARPPARLG